LDGCPPRQFNRRRAAARRPQRPLRRCPVSGRLGTAIRFHGTHSAGRRCSRWMRNSGT